MKVAEVDIPARSNPTQGSGVEQQICSRSRRIDVHRARQTSLQSTLSYPTAEGAVDDLEIICSAVHVS